jgi:hypothetical protein
MSAAPWLTCRNSSPGETSGSTRVQTCETSHGTQNKFCISLFELAFIMTKLFKAIHSLINTIL